MTHDGPRAHQTVIGHSYGTTAVGHAASSGVLDADDVVLVASPGVGADHASDLHLRGHPDSADHVWATTASQDPIAKAVSPRELLRNDAKYEPTSHKYMINGVNPIHHDFGGHVFTSAPGTGGSTTHSAYWDSDNPSRTNIGRIIVGKYGEVN